MVRLPQAAERVWFWFWRLDRTRSFTIAGPGVLTFHEIDSMFRLLGCRPRDWEVRAMVAMDMARVELLRRESGGDRVSAEPLTMALFDALF